MRIAMVCPYSFSHSGGVQNHVMGLADWLSSHGDDVDVLAPGELAQSTWKPGPRATFTSAGPALPVPYNGSVARIKFDPHAALRVRQWLSRSQPDVVHVHEPITPSISVLTLWQTTAPLIATFHTATPGSRSMHVANTVMPKTMARIDRSIAVSTVARDVARSHIGADPVVIGNGIDALPRGAFPGPVPGAPPRICLVGRYDEPRKGWQVFAAALPRLQAALPGLEVVVMGEGSPKAVPGVHFTGWVDDQTRNRWIASSHVFVAPHTGRESFGIVLLEAMELGTQIVASDLPAFREVLEDEQGLVGRLFPVGDADALADAVLATFASPAPTERGHARAAQFEWSQIGPQVRAQYVALLDDVSQRGRDSGYHSAAGFPG